MSIYWEAFTPWSALAGGALIGLAAALMVVLLGRIAGISGIVGNLLQAATWGSVGQWGWRVAFVLGMVAAPIVWQWFAPFARDGDAFQPLGDRAGWFAGGLWYAFGLGLHQWGTGCAACHACRCVRWRQR